MDDEMIEASYAGGDKNDNFDADAEQPERTKEFDWSPESMIVEGSPAEEVAAAFEPKFVFEETREEEEADALELEGGPSFEQENEIDIETPTQEESEESVQPAAVETEPVAENNGASAEPSAELINLIAQRVIERLSDTVIREVAQDAVPQIAEKLIREALEDESKT
jgi:hypothetical protein